VTLGNFAFVLPVRRHLDALHGHRHAAQDDVHRWMRPENRDGEGECLPGQRWAFAAVYNNRDRRLESLAVHGEARGRFAAITAWCCRATMPRTPSDLDVTMEETGKRWHRQAGQHLGAGCPEEYLRHQPEYQPQGGGTARLHY